jgi:hypothetical protein
MKISQLIGWCSAIIALFTVAASLAPFVPSVLFIAFLLPAAAFSAWRGAVLPSLLTVLFCVAALAVSPIPIASLFKLSLFSVWIAICIIAVVIGQIHGRRRAQSVAA